MNQIFYNWIKAFRLRTLPLAFSCIITGSFIHYHEHFSWIIFILALSTTLFLQVLSNLANDYGDFVKGTDNDSRVGPKRSIQSGEISKDQMKNAIIICSIISFISGILLLGFSLNWNFYSTFFLFLILGLAGITAAIKYTVGKNALAYHALGDVFVYLFFGLVGVLGCSFLQTGSFYFNDILIASTIGLWSSAVLNMNNMRDHINDAAQNKNTLVVKMGFSNAKYYHTFLITSGLAAATIYLLSIDSVSLLSLIAAVPLLLNIKKVFQTSEPEKLDSELKKIALSTFAFSLILSTILSL